MGATSAAEQAGGTQLAGKASAEPEIVASRAADALDPELRRVLDFLPDAVFIHCDGRFVYANAAGIQLLRAQSIDEVVGLPTMAYIHPDDRETVARRRDYMVEHQGRVPLLEQRRIALDGAVIEVESVAIPCRWQGRPAVLAMNRDITERKRMEALLIEARQIAESSDRAKSAFLAAVSHELRTPLNAIIGFAELLNLEPLGPLGAPSYRSYVEDIFRSGHHLLAIINDILDLSKVEAGKMELDEEAFALAELFESALRMVRERARVGKIELGAVARDALPWLFADRRRMLQVLVNLLANAVKFTPEGGRVAVDGAVGADGAITIRVVDTGIGMTADEAARAFLPFEQVDASLGRKYEGAGLGLPLSERLLALHGGTIAIESAPGHGTTVAIRLPAERVTAPQTPAPAAPASR